jgi:EF hand domain-containing protein
MMKKRNMVFAVLLVAMLFAIGATIAGTVFAQKAAVPKPQDTLALGEEQVKQLLLLMDADKKGQISKQEWMRFMETAFDRLDKNKSGDLDVKELTQSRMSIRHGGPADVGK